MAENNNFALIIVGLVAVVAIVGMLNLNGNTGKVVTDVTKNTLVLEDGTLAWCDAQLCEEANGKTCNFISTDVGKSCSKPFATVENGIITHTYRGYYRP